MRILMFGWEFPPRMSGGLGTACFGMTAALAGLGHRITFVLPQPGEASAAPFLDIVSASDPLPRPIRKKGNRHSLQRPAIRPVPSLLSPYLNGESYRELYLSEGKRFPERAVVYGPDLIAEVIRYGRAGGAIAAEILLRHHPRPRLDDGPRRPERPPDQREAARSPCPLPRVRPER